MNHSLIGQALRGLAVFFAAFVLDASGVAQASSFSVNPVRVTLSAKQPVAAITVRNSGTESTVVQLETTAWSQDQGADVLQATGDLLATPPIFTVPAGGTQIVRVGLRGARDMKGEVTYRLILREVPPSKPLQTGLRVALKISMPIFVVPSTNVAPDLQWRAARSANGQVRVYATNTGNAHVQLGKLELAAGGSVLGSRNLAEYVLPGNTRSWLVEAKGAPATGAKVRISTTSDSGAFQSDVALEVETAASGSAAPAALAAR
jgi:fimbrial chaperone protein